MLKKRGARGLAVGAAAVLCVLALNGVQAFRRLEWKSWDVRMALFANPARASKDIVLIQVDQYSLDFFEKQSTTWPWPRMLYAAIIGHLRAGGAKACFFDITMTERSRYEGDDASFAAAEAEAGNVFLPVFLDTNQPDPTTAPDEAAMRAFREKAEAALAKDSRGVSPRGGLGVRGEIFRSVTLPIPEILSAARGLANVRVMPDDDGIYRRMPLLFPFRESFFVSSVPMALAQAARPAGNFPPIPLDRDRRMVIRFFRTDPKTGSAYPSYTAAAVINSYAQMLDGQKPQLDPAVFAGKTVLVGLTAVGLFDVKANPLSGAVPGVEIQAAALDTILNGRAFRFPGGALTWLYIGLLALLAGWTVSVLRKPWAQAAAFAGFLLIPSVLSTAAFAAGTWLEFVAPEAAVLLTIIGAAVLNYAVEGKERRFLKGVFHHYLSPAVIDRIISDPGRLRLGGEQREVTSFFSDVAGFTSISEALTPADLVALLNELLTEMTDLILDSGGTLDKYEGDAIIAFWNAPLDDPDHALHAARTALACQARLAAIAPDLETKYGRRIRMRIGLNTGPAIVGNMGSARRFDYTAIGDTINLASRLESAGKQYGVHLLAGEATLKKTGDALISREVDVIRVVGKKEPIRIFELIGEKGKVDDVVLRALETFARGLSRFRARDFSGAEGVFSGLGDDPVAALYRDRSRVLAASPPPDDWDFVTDLKSK